MSQIQIPKGWESKVVNDVVELIYGKNLPKEKRNTSGKYPVYGSNGIVGYHDKFLVDYPSIVIGRKGTVGAINLAQSMFWPTDVTYYVKIKDSNKIDFKFLHYLLLHLNLPQYRQSGPKSGLNRNDIYKIKFLLPKLSTQKKVVEKLDYILGQLEEKKKIILEIFGEKKDKLQYLSDLAIAEVIIKLMKLDSSESTWNIKNLEEVCESIQPGFAQGIKNVKGGTIHLRMNNISTNFELNLDLIRTINATREQLEKYNLKKGDIIFNNTNSPDLVGKSAIFRMSYLCLYSNHLTRLRVKKDVLPEWILFYLRGRWLRRDFKKMCNKWINQAAVNNNMIRILEIPIPPLEVQHKIIEKLKKFSNGMENIRARTKQIIRNDQQNMNYLEDLSTKILEYAFTGKLIN